MTAMLVLLVATSTSASTPTSAPRTCVVVDDRTGQAGELDDTIAQLLTRDGLPATTNQRDCAQTMTVRVLPRPTLVRRNVSAPIVLSGPATVPHYLAPAMGETNDGTPNTNFHEAAEDARRDWPTLKNYPLVIEHTERAVMVRGSVELRAAGETKPWLVQSFELATYTLDEPNTTRAWRRTLGRVAVTAADVGVRAIVTR
jgi:hypothetical protein